jgi:hypothetical protein
MGHDMEEQQHNHRCWPGQTDVNCECPLVGHNKPSTWLQNGNLRVVVPDIDKEEVRSKLSPAYKVGHTAELPALQWQQHPPTRKFSLPVHPAPAHGQ